MPLPLAAGEDSDSEARWVIGLREGDDRALDAIMAHWERPLFSFAWRYLRNEADAHETVAETFVRLHRCRASLARDTRLSAWLFTTLANLCHNQHRWRRRHPTVSLDAASESGGTAPSEELHTGEAPPGAVLERSESAAALLAAVERLPHELKTTLLLHHYERLPYRDIARVTGCSERGVETRLYRARLRLRTELAGWLGS